MVSFGYQREGLGAEGIVRESGIDTAIFKMGNKALLCSTGNSAQYYVTT